MAAHNETGKKGEALAVKYLAGQGYEILETNFRWQKAEIDLIARQNKTIIFIEVKTRSTDYFGPPSESVTKKKMKLMAETADYYVISRQLDCEVRYDIISIILNKTTQTIHHIKDAFYPYASDLD